MNLEGFINFIKKYISVSEETENSIIQIAEYHEPKKGVILLEQGKTCKQLYFLVIGTVRTYFYQNDKDITHWVYIDGSIFTSYHSYILQKPSVEYIEAAEDCKIISISYSNWQKLYKKHPELERFGRLMMEEQMASIDGFYKGYYFLSAKEKYDLLIENYPNILQKANLGHIASMLGISQETLSRIRGRQ